LEYCFANHWVRGEMIQLFVASERDTVPLWVIGDVEDDESGDDGDDDGDSR